MSKRIKTVLERFKKEARALYAGRLKDVILFGSWARDEATAGSDIDIMVVLKGKVSPAKEIDRMIDIVTDILLERGELISLYPVSEKDYGSLRSPLLLNARREGIPA
jgi:predicted nucleotidyltransferase